MGVPSNILIPWVGVSFDSSRAVSGPANMPVILLYIGQKTAAGLGTVEELTLISGPDEVRNLGGPGSMIYRQVAKGSPLNKSTKAYIVMLDDDVAGVAATQTVTVADVATANGAVYMYIAGELMAVSVVALDDADVVGAAMAAAINANTDLQVTAAYATGVLTITCKNKGVAAGDIDVRFNYEPTEAFPAGLSIALGTFTAGTGDPDIQDALDAIGDMWANVAT